MDTIYSQFQTFANDFAETHQPIAVDGGAYELEGVTVYHTSTQPLQQKGRIEVNQVTPEASSSFEWHTEITLKDKLEDEFIHLILQPDRTAAETYGKTVIPINNSRATEILACLKRATESDPPKPPRQRRTA